MAISQQTQNARQALQNLSSGGKGTFDINNAIVNTATGTGEEVAPAFPSTVAATQQTAVTTTPVEDGNIDLLEKQVAELQLRASALNAQTQTGQQTLSTVNPQAGQLQVSQQAEQTAAGTQTQQTATQTAPQSIEVNLADPNVMILTPDGRRMTAKEAYGQMMLQSKFSQKQRELLDEKRVVDAQKHLLDNAAKSEFGAIYLQALAQGKPESEAIDLGLRAAKRIGSDGKMIEAQQTAPATEPPIPKDDDPDYTTKLLSRLTWENAQALQKIVAPLTNMVAANAGPTPEQQAAMARVKAHNDQLVEVYLEPYFPTDATPAQQKFVADYIREVGKREDVPLDKESYNTKPLSDSDLKVVRNAAFPGGGLPNEIAQQYLALGGQQTAQQTAQQFGQQQTAQQFTQTVPLAGQNPNALLPQGAVLTPDAQKLAAFQRVSELQNQVKQLSEQLGLLPPRIPTQPVAEASPTSHALHDSSPAFKERVGDRVSRDIRSIPYAK